MSVDQDRLTAFLKVAESLRIKGLTEVNEEKCDIPSITSSLLGAASLSGGQMIGLHQQGPPQPQQQQTLHRILPHPMKRPHPMHSHHSNPLLGSALSAPKRKRGRPRKLSGIYTQFLVRF